MEDYMADIAIFMNLPDGHPEGNKRKANVEGETKGHSHDYVYGGADNANYGNKAQYLINNNPQAKVFVATCWPTMNALAAAPKPIVVAGLVTNQPFPPGVVGKISFAAGELCPFWPALLKYVAPASLKEVAIIYDHDPSRPGMVNEETIIEQSFGTFGFNLTRIYADDPTNPTNPNIGSDIADFLQGVGHSPAGLIVTAGTRTTMLREVIIAAVAARNTSADKLFAIYPSSIFMDTSGALLAYGPDLQKLYKDVAKNYVKPIADTGTATGLHLDLNHDFELIVSKKAAAAVNFNIRRRSTSSSPTDRCNIFFRKLFHEKRIRTATGSPGSFWRGCVLVAGGLRSASRGDAANWRADASRSGRLSRTRSHHNVPPGAARTGLDRRRQLADRCSVGPG
jgi:hypothetical protein